MKNENSSLSKQQGFSLLEVLIALAISSIVVLGSSKVMGHMLKTQAEMNLQSLVIETLQLRLQTADNDEDKDICEAIDLSDFSIATHTFQLGCAKVEIKKDGKLLTARPVLAADTNKTAAQRCAAAGNSTGSCFVLGN